MDRRASKLQPARENTVHDWVCTAERMCYDTRAYLNYRSLELHTEAAGTAPPDAFGPFRVLHQIGAGALGPVFRAYDAEGERLVAVKLFRLDLPPVGVHQLVDAFERLIECELSHPSLVVPIATGIVGASAYLAVEYVSAESLDLAVREYGPAPPLDAVRL